MVLGQKEGRVSHVQDGVVHQHHFTEVKLVGEPLPFGFVQNALVVVIPAEEGGEDIDAGMDGEVEKDKGKRKRGGKDYFNARIKVLCFLTVSKE